MSDRQASSAGSNRAWRKFVGEGWDFAKRAAQSSTGWALASFRLCAAAGAGILHGGRREHERLVEAIFQEERGSAGEARRIQELVGSRSGMRVERRSGEALFLTARARNFQAAQALIAAGSNVNGSAQKRPLLGGLDEEDAGVTRLLLSAGADAKLMGLSMPSSCEQTALHCACSRAMSERVKDLLPCSEVDAIDANGKTCLMRIYSGISREEKRLEIQEMLIKAGASLSIEDDGETVLDYAIESGARLGAMALFRAGAKQGSVRAGQSLVAQALSHGHRELAEDLAEAGACLAGGGSGKYGPVGVYWEKPISDAPPTEETAPTLHWAARTGSLKILERILAQLPPAGEERRRLLNEKSAARNMLGDIPGRSPLMLAAASGSTECVAMLLAAGAEVGQALAKGSPTVSRGSLGAARAGVAARSTLAMAVLSGSADATRLILNASKPSPAEKDEAFWCACFVGLEIMRMLSPSSMDVKKGGVSAVAMALTVFVTEESFCGMSEKQMDARRAEQLEIIRELVSRGAGLSAGESSVEPLHLAIEGGRLDFVEALLGGGASPWVEDEDGRGALTRVLELRNRSIGMLGMFSDASKRRAEAALPIAKILVMAMERADQARLAEALSIALCRGAAEEWPFAKTEAFDFLAMSAKMLAEALAIKAAMEPIQPGSALARKIRL